MRKILTALLINIFSVSVTACPEKEGGVSMDKGNNQEYRIAVFGGGCFWCMEAVFEQLSGVAEVISGYAGGRVKNPSYEQVCTGLTGHAEVVKIVYDPYVITYDELLSVFWKAHDPTQVNRQGADVGTQYRSVIFYGSIEEKQAAENSRAALEKSGFFSRPVATEIVSLDKFYPAEEYHQDYYRNNRQAGYCQLVITPKLEKLGLPF